MAKPTLLAIVQDKEIPRSTAWARANKGKVREKDLQRKNTVDGKLISLITQSRHRCKSSKLEHTIDTKYLKNLWVNQKGCCALTGKIMVIFGPRGTPDFWNSISIDRIDSNKGYIEGNVQLVCTAVNIMKMDMTNEFFIDFCESVAEYHNAKT